MSIRYEFHKPIGVCKEKAKAFARIKHHQTIKTKTLIDRIQRASSLTHSDIKATLIALAETLTEELSMGNRVHLEGLGYFSLAMQAEIKQQDDGTFQTQKPRIKNIKFIPEKTLLKQFANLHFRAKDHNANIPQGLTLEEAKTIARNLLQETPAVFTPKQFAYAANIKLYTAYNILHALENQNIIRNIGTTRRKLYAQP